MQIEVPSDKYESAIQAMQERIRRGEVPGVSDPNEAQQIVRKGHFTYEQAKNIAKAGTVESLTYDAANGMIIASSAFGVTAVLTFATSVWNGDTPEIALKNAAYSGLKVGGISFVTAIFAGQLSKAGLNSLLVGSSEAVVRVMGPKTSALLVNAFRQGKNIYGAAAMKSASKLLRGNIITGSASVVILSAGPRTYFRKAAIQERDQYRILCCWRHCWLGRRCRRRRCNRFSSSDHRYCCRWCDRWTGRSLWRRRAGRQSILGGDGSFHRR